MMFNSIANPPLGGPRSLADLIQGPAAPAQQKSFFTSPQFGDTLLALGSAMLSGTDKNPIGDFGTNLQALSTQRRQQEEKAAEEAKLAEQQRQLSAAIIDRVHPSLRSLAESQPELAVRLHQQYYPDPEPLAPIKVGAGDTLLDPTTYQPLYQGAPDPTQSFGHEKDLYSQYSAADPLKTYQGVRNGYERVRASAERGDGPGDISLVFAYMKMLDPTSVVREGEFATAETAGGVGSQISNIYNRLLQGERLTPELRKQFVSAADSLYGETAANLEDLNTQFTTRAQAWNVNPANFLVTPEVYQTSGGGADPLGIR